MRGLLLLTGLLWAGLIISSEPLETTVKDPIYFSWQVDHPMVTGLISSLTFGLWSSSFGSDVVESPNQTRINNGLICFDLSSGSSCLC